MSQQPPNQLLTLPGLSGGDANDVSTASLPWWRKPRNIIGIVIALLLVIFAIFGWQFINRKPPVNYQTQQVTQGDLSLTINATGPIQSSVYNLVFQGSGGKITELDVKQGQKVTKGQVLAKLDKTALQDALNTSQANLDVAKTNLNTAINNAGATANQVNVGINVAQTAVGVNTNNQTASIGSGNASVANAQTALDNAQNSLDAAQQSADATRNQADAQLQQSLLNCSSSGSSSSSTSGALLLPFLPALNLSSDYVLPAGSSPVASPSPVESPVASPSPSPTSAPAKTPTPDPAKVSACKDAAQATHDSTIATADANVTNAQNSVDAAQSNLTVAQANGNQSITSSVIRSAVSSAFSCRFSSKHISQTPHLRALFSSK